jgi:hypothetical protein
MHFFKFPEFSIENYIKCNICEHIVQSEQSIKRHISCNHPGVNIKFLYNSIKG